MIRKIQEGDYVIYTSQKGYDYFNSVLSKMYEEAYFNIVLTSINWNQNKKYFITKKDEK